MTAAKYGMENTPPDKKNCDEDEIIRLDEHGFTQSADGWRIAISFGDDGEPTYKWLPPPEDQRP